MAEAPKQSNPDYQDRDILIKPILYSVIGMAILTVLVVVGMNVFFHVMEQDMVEADSQLAAEELERQLPPMPRLVVDEKLELEEYLANARAVMESSVILDAEQGIARIPVELAMQRVAEQGLPEWPLVMPAGTQAVTAVSASSIE